MTKIKTKQYWYRKEIGECVACGKQMIDKYRVYDKSKAITIIYRADCGC